MRVHAAPRRNNGPGGSSWAKVGWLLLIILLVAELASVFLLSNRGKVTTTSSSSSVRAKAPVTEKDKTLGYTFEKPEGWSVKRDRTTSILTREDDAGIISIALLTGDDPEIVSSEILALLGEQYRRLDVIKERHIGAASTVWGRALNSRRVQLRFVSITTSAGEGCQHQIVAFSDVDVSRPEIDGVVDDLLESLETTEEGCTGRIGA